MKRLAEKLKKFFSSEDGPTAVEYAVMLALIIIVCLGSIQSVGTTTSGTFDDVNRAFKKKPNTSENGQENSGSDWWN